MLRHSSFYFSLTLQTWCIWVPCPPSSMNILSWGKAGTSSHGKGWLAFSVVWCSLRCSLCHGSDKWLWMALPSFLESHNGTEASGLSCVPKRVLRVSWPRARPKVTVIWLGTREDLAVTNKGPHPIWAVALVKSDANSGEMLSTPVTFIHRHYISLELRGNHREMVRTPK